MAEINISMVRAGRALSVAAAAILLTVMFWRPLWTGGGFIGGDTYTYYFPQQVVYSEALRHGELPLWNPLVSLGYPQFAESQTGELYKVQYLLYRLLDVSTAYNATHLLHYMAAFVFAWLFARRWGLSVIGAHLAALVYVYGWFPPRACLEWAIVGGAYFPLLLWCGESYLQSAKTRWLLLLALAQSELLSAGHYNLAFITLVTLSLLWAGRLSFARARLHERIDRQRVRATLAGIAAVGIGFAAAAPQLMATIELKQLSQRENYASQTYGYVPPWYLSQALWPLLWYGPEMNPDGALWSTSWGSPPAPPGSTNKVEAHLYFGVAPFYLLLVGSVCGARRGRRPGRTAMLWIVLGLASVALATGWPLLLLRHLPGFGFFAGPGRYGMVTTLAVALGAGAMLDRAVASVRGRTWRTLLVAGMFSLTIVDLWLVSRWVTNVVMVSEPPVVHQQESTVGQRLREERRPVRMFAPGPNLPTLTGINCVPEYLGIGPAAYYDPQLAMPKAGSDASLQEVRRQIDWLQRAGVTHILRFEPLDESLWPIEGQQQVFDPFLNAAWGRSREPLYLSTLRGSRPRAFIDGQPSVSVGVIRSTDNDVTLNVNAPAGGPLVLLELAYPGWSATIDGRPTEWSTFEGQYRAVEIPPGVHQVHWTFRPTSFRTSAWVMLGAWLTIVVWAVGAWRTRSRRSLNPVD